ncbi:hypothetical protein AA15669_0699 [Saccharibacter floricola DSM 15669]|uniref:Bacterial CdiA-CT RNAse A domain-containing protein n=1 Tax=Saccharibacter floricola DSM 15669 TaxID=1123227 RepID=A0ABQ0NXP1_9PROT|nr:hypothetical protein AA15669_0699 [Saccharibacter floricola DSM 15669]
MSKRGLSNVGKIVLHYIQGEGGASKKALAEGEKTTEKTLEEGKEPPLSGKEKEDEDIPPEFAAGSSSKIVPGGGLQAHEDLGGHLIERHVGKSIEYLQERLANTKWDDAVMSTFSDRATAERAISEALESPEGIEAITKALSSKKPIPLNYNMPYNVGGYLRKGDNALRGTKSIRIVLKKNPKSPSGWSILTGFPVP